MDDQNSQRLLPTHALTRIAVLAVEALIVIGIGLTTLPGRIISHGVAALFQRLG